MFNISQVSNMESGFQENYFWLPGIAIATVYGLLLIIGLIGNVTLMRICITVKSMRTVPNLFLSSLALGDLLLLITCAPVDASRYLVDKWLFGRVGCKLIPFIQLTSVGVSVFTLTALSADRYKAIVNPMDFQKSTPKTCFWAAAIWVFSMTLAIPEAVFSDFHTFNIEQTNVTFETCAPYPHTGELHPKIHSMAFFLIFYIIPLLITSIYYCFIACSLTQSTSDMPLHNTKQIESRKRLAKTVLVFVVLFAVCWLPSHMIYLYRSYHYGQVDTSTGHFIASVCARVLAFTNSCVNPFSLYLLSNSFQKQFNEQLCCHSLRPVTFNPQGTGQSNTHLTSLKSRKTSLANFSLANRAHFKEDLHVAS